MHHCQTPVLGQGLGVDFAWDNNNNNEKNPHINFLERNSTRGLGTNGRDNG